MLVKDSGVSSTVGIGVLVSGRLAAGPMEIMVAAEVKDARETTARVRELELAL